MSGSEVSGIWCGVRSVQVGSTESSFDFNARSYTEDEEDNETYNVDRAINGEFKREQTRIRAERSLV